MKIRSIGTVAGLLALSLSAEAGLNFNVGGSWDSDVRRQAAIDSLTAATARFNAFGDLGNYNIYAYYNAGIPTAQSDYTGAIGYGGTWPNERVTMHEMSHYLGTGTTWQWGSLMVNGVWNGAIATALVRQFEGDQAVLNGDGAHYWPYGLNYDSEGSEIGKQREVAMVYALRADMGLGPASAASSVTSVALRASDAVGESGFNYASTWSDTHFAHANASYSTGNFTLRTPASGNSFTFAGSGVTVNNTNGVNGGLLYKGTGTGGVVTFKNLVLDGGYVRHATGTGDLFQLGGRVTLVGSPTIDAAQGNITVLAHVTGPGSLTKAGGNVVTLSGGASYAGETRINAGTLRLTPVVPVASYSFDTILGSTVLNGGAGGAAMNGTLSPTATIVGGGGVSGNAVKLSGGASVDINNPIADLGNNASWTVSAWVKTATAGGSILTKGDGTGWSSGNTIFYLGDGSAGGSGGVPGAVRWGGGFFQGAPTATAVTNNAWHQLTYVNNAGAYAIFVDGVAQPLSAGNGGFATADVGSIVRLGVSTDTVAGDGAVNFNGLLDNVQFYSQALSAGQVASLYQGAAVSPLPIATNVTIAGGATLDVNGAVEQIGALNGVAGSAVALGHGRLAVNSLGSSTFAGTISGSGGALDKSGAGTLTLTGTNTYSGATSVNGGTLAVTGSVAGSSGVTVNNTGRFQAAARQRVKTLTVNAGGVASVAGAATMALTVGDGATAYNPLIITGSGRLDLTTNGLIVDYAAGNGPAVLASVRGQIIAGFAGGTWTGGGGIGSSSAAQSGGLGIGYALSSEVLGASGGPFMGSSADGDAVIARCTLLGDANLDGVVDFSDLALLAQNYNTTDGTRGWVNGDFTYDGNTDFADLATLAQNYNTGLAGAGVPGASAAFDRDLAAAFAVVPEPGGAVVAGMLGLAWMCVGRGRGRRRATP